MQFSTGAFIHTAGHPQLLAITSDGLCVPGETEEVLQRVVRFCAAGFRADGMGGQK